MRVEEISRERYEEFEKNSPLRNMFTSRWWLDAVSSDWVPIGVLNKKEILVAVMPTPRLRGRFNRSSYQNPVLTRYLAILFREQPGKYLTKLSGQEAPLTAIAKYLKGKRVNYFVTYNQDYLLPFTWEGYSLNPMYTFVLNSSIYDNEDQIFSGFRENVRREIRRSLRVNVVRQGYDLDELYEVYKNSFVEKGLPVPMSVEVMRRVDSAINENLKRYIFLASSDDIVNSFAYFVEDRDEVRYLFGGSVKGHLNGAPSHLLWEGIRVAHRERKKFNFEGSLDPRVHRFFRAFNGKLITYFSISNINKTLFNFF